MFSSLPPLRSIKSDPSSAECSLTLKCRRCEPGLLLCGPQAARGQSSGYITPLSGLPCVGCQYPSIDSLLRSLSLFLFLPSLMLGSFLSPSLHLPSLTPSSLICFSLGSIHPSIIHLSIHHPPIHCPSIYPFVCPSMIHPSSMHPSMIHPSSIHPGPRCHNETLLC